MAVDVALGVTTENDGPTGDFAGDEIVRFLQLRRVADIDPAFGENLGHFVGEHGARKQRLPVEQELLLDGVVDDVMPGHGRSSTQGPTMALRTVAPGLIRCYGRDTIGIPGGVSCTTR